MSTSNKVQRLISDAKSRKLDLHVGSDLSPKAADEALWQRLVAIEPRLPLLEDWIRRNAVPEHSPMFLATHELWAGALRRVMVGELSGQAAWDAATRYLRRVAMEAVK